MDVLLELTRRIPGFLGVLGVLLILNASLGSAAVTAAPIDLETAVDRALAENPRLALAGFRREIQEGEILQSSLKPNLELDLELENFFGTGPFSGIDAVSTTLSLIWVLERGKRQHRMAAAEGGRVRIESGNELERLEIAADTTEAFLEVLRDQQRTLQAAEAVRLAEEAVEAVARRVRVGRSPKVDLTRAEADLAWFELDREDVAHVLLVSRQILISNWGAKEADFTVASGNLFGLPEPIEYAVLLARAGASPLMRHYLTEQRVRDAELLLAEAEAKTDWRVRAGARHLGLVDESAFVAGITMPLGFRNRNQGRIAAAKARSAMTSAEQVATRVRIEAALFGLHQELLHNIHRANAMREEVIPKMEAVLAETQEAYAAGRYGYSELRQAQIALLETRSAFLEENFQAHRNRVGVERLTGTSVTGSEGGDRP